MKKIITTACVIVGIVMGFGSSAIGHVNLAYDPGNGSLLVDTGDHVLTTLHITATIDFFTGPKPPEFNGVFDRFTPRKLFKLSLFGFGDLTLPPGTVVQGLSAEQVVDSISVDCSYSGGATLNSWCLNGEFCFLDPSVGDFNNDFALDQADIDVLTNAVSGFTQPLPAESHKFDLDFDGALSQADRQVWVNTLKRTYFGDSNLDGEFNSRDLVAVFQSGEYDDEHARNSQWQDGDWDGDLEFGSGDLILAFQSSGYFKGPRTATPVPEPAGCPLAILLMSGFLVVGQRPVFCNKRLAKMVMK